MTLAVVTGLLLTAAFAQARYRTARGTPARWSLLGVLALVGMICSACSSHATAGSVVAVVRPSPPAVQVSGEPGYLALGDSIAFGYRPRSSPTVSPRSASHRTRLAATPARPA